MKRTIALIVFVFISMSLRGEDAGNLPAKAFGFGHIADKVEYVQSFSAHGTALNYTDISHQIGKVAFNGDVYGLHHGTIGAASVTIPFRIKNLTLSPGALAVFGPYETGPGFGARWQLCQSVLCTEGTIGWFRPLKDGKGLQFLGDPIDVDLLLFNWTKTPWLKETHLGYSGEFGRYGKYGETRDRIHGAQTKLGAEHPVSNWTARHLTRRETELLVTYVPDGRIFRFGITVNPKIRLKKH
jgi:hypothetical protein